MAEYAVMPKSDYQAACDKIRAKTGKTETIKSGDLAAEIDSIGGADPVIHSLTVTENGTYEATEGVDGYSPVTVNVAGSGGPSDSDAALIGLIERTATKITIPDGCTKIGNYVFYLNAALKSVNFPDGLTSIGAYAFSGCTRLALTSLPDGVTSIGNAAFNSCSNLALTSLPDGVTSIGSDAFNGCTSLALTSLPAGVTSIGAYAFYNCTKLALTSLPDGVTSIGNRAFRYCTNLTKLTFKGKPSSVASDAFNGCTNLLTINVPWAEGEVTNAPWGATNATINYNYTGG